jgi:hypothetical protein
MNETQGMGTRRHLSSSTTTILRIHLSRGGRPSILRLTDHHLYSDEGRSMQEAALDETLFP